MPLQEKPLKIRYMPKFSKNLNEISSYVGRSSIIAAERLLERIRNRIELLAEHPHIGRAAMEPVLARRGIRIIGESKYITYYAVEDEEIVVYHIRHSARRSAALSDLFDEND